MDAHDTPHDTDPLLTQGQAAELLTVAPETLERWRQQLCGPRYIRLGRLIRYRRSAIEQYITEQTIEHCARR